MLSLLQTHGRVFSMDGSVQLPLTTDFCIACGSDYIRV